MLQGESFARLLEHGVVCVLSDTRMAVSSWNLVEALSSPRDHSTEWQPQQHIVEAAMLATKQGRRLEEGERPPPSPHFLPIDDYFAPRDKPSSFGLSSNLRQAKPPIIHFEDLSACGEDSHSSSRDASPQVFGQGISSPRSPSSRAPTVTFALPQAESETPSLARTLAPPSPLVAPATVRSLLCSLFCRACCVFLSILSLHPPSPRALSLSLACAEDTRPTHEEGLA